MGQKFVAYDASGAIIGFYDSEDSPPPKGVATIEITEEQWMTCLQNPGWTVKGGALVEPPPPDPAQILVAAQRARIAILSAAYVDAVSAPVTYGAHTFQADPQSVANLQAMLTAFAPTKTAPEGFYWLAADNTQVPFTYADIEGLAQAIGVQAFAAFQKLQTLKAQVRAAADVATVNNISW